MSAARGVNLAGSLSRRIVPCVRARVVGAAKNTIKATTNGRAGELGGKRWTFRRGISATATQTNAYETGQGGGVKEPTPKVEHLGFGFSAGGLLFPYYVGVCDVLKEEGLLTPTTPLAGASAGSLIAVSVASGRPTSDILLGLDEMAKDLRVYGTRGRMKEVLEKILKDLLPDDIHLRANGRVHVAVTRVLPSWKPELLTEFESKEDLIAALMTSCYIPWYFDQSRLGTRFRDGWYCDGGLTNFIPVPPGVERAVRVCCLPGRNVGMTVGIDIDIAPDAQPHGWPQMVAWALQPGTEEELVVLRELGRSDTLKWVQLRKERLEAGMDDKPLGLPPTQVAPPSGSGVVLPSSVTEIFRSGGKRTIATISAGLERQAKAFARIDGSRTEPLGGKLGSLLEGGEPQLSPGGEKAGKKGVALSAGIKDGNATNADSGVGNANGDS